MSRAAALGQQLERSRAQLLELIECLPIAMYVAVREGTTGSWRTLYVTGHVAALTGYRPEEWYERPRLWLELLHPDDAPTTGARALAAQEAGVPFRAEYRLRRRDGRTVWIHEEAAHLRSAGGTDYWHGVMVDVTDRRLAEDERRKALVRLIETQERERARLTEGVHDEVLQTLTAIALRLATARRRTGEADLHRAVAEAERDLEAAIAGLRRLVFEVEPAGAAPRAIADALRAVLDDRDVLDLRGAEAPGEPADPRRQPDL